MGSSTKCFDWASSFYDYSRAIPDDLMRKLIEILQDKLKIDSNSKILEVGVGTGRIAIPLTKKLHINTIGVDISERMLQKCQERISYTENIQLILADGLTLPFKNSQFNIILTSHILHLLSNVHQFINKILPLLVKNGFYVNLEAYVNYTQTIPFEIYYSKLSESGFRHIYLTGLVRRGLIIYLSRRGWKHKEYIIRSERTISNNDLVRFIQNRVFSHQRNISPDLHQQALQYLYKELEEKCIDLSKTVFAPAISRLNIFEWEKQ